MEDHGLADQNEDWLKEASQVSKNNLARLDKEVKRYSLVKTVALIGLLVTLPAAVFLVQTSTRPQSKAAGGETQEVKTTLTQHAGDLDNNGCVNFADLSVLKALFGKNVVAGMLGDLNADGKITAGDIKIWIGNYGQGCQ